MSAFERASILAVSVLVLSGCTHQEAPQNIVVVHVGAGDWAAANVAAYVEPFEAETGIKVVRFADDIKTSQLRMMHDTDNVQVDVISMTAMHSARAAALGLLKEVDYSKYRPDEIEDMSDEVRKPWGVGALYYSMVLGWSARQPGTSVPTNWLDFWDVKRFPGKRTLMTGQYGDGPWEEALIADGVPKDRLYPMDIDRVFRSLDRIRPHVTKWWRVGSEGQQLFRDNIVDVGGVYDGRIAAIAAARTDAGFTYEQGKLLLDYWVVPAKAPHAANAQRFVEFATRARQQAIFAQRMAYGPTNLGAFEFIPDALARQLCSHPDNLARQIHMNIDWYTQTDEYGVSNIERLIERWTEWVLQ
jgi:putative spermidine/putrescine transport system substrate-binding protein